MVDIETTGLVFKSNCLHQIDVFKYFDPDTQFGVPGGDHSASGRVVGTGTTRENETGKDELSP